jgi:hypothetical protein
MATAIITHPLSIDLDRPQDGLKIETIVTDPGWCQYFSALADHYSGLLHEVTKDTKLIGGLGSVIYLIDVDVIRNLVEDRYQDPRLQREAIRLFADPLFRYAIPLGAFEELIVWLRGFLSSRMAWKEDYKFTGNLSRLDTLRELASSFGISIDSSNDPKILDQLFAKLRSFTPLIERLIEFLNRRNFEGVITDYESEDVADINAILGQAPRLEHKPDEASTQRAFRDSDKVQGTQSALNSARTRVRRDFHDATNLAIICKSARAKREHIRSNRACTSYALITETKVLLNLVHYVRESNNELTNDLSRLLGSKGSVLPGLYPVLTPRRAFIVEDVRRRYDIERTAIDNLQRERSVYDTLGDTLRESMRSLQTGSNELVLPETLTSSLQHLIGVYRSEDSFYRDLERNRALEASLKLFEKKHKLLTTVEVMEQVHSDKIGLEAAAESFFKVLSRLSSLLNKWTPTSYILRQPMTDESGKFEEIVIHSINPPELVIQGERYLGELPGLAPSYLAYSFRWTTASTDRQFFDALNQVVEISKGGQRGQPLEVVPLPDDQDLQSEAMLIFTDAGPYYTPLAALSDALSSNHSFIDELRLVINPLSPEDPSGKERKIQAIRVVTLFGDFQLDIMGDDEGTREVFVISHYNLGEQIAYLCEATSLSIVFPNALNEELQKITSVFAHYSERSKTGEAA